MTHSRAAGRISVDSSLSTGDIPLHLNIREMSDRGKPVVVSSPGSPEVSTPHVFNAQGIWLCSTLHLRALVCFSLSSLSRRRPTGRWRQPCSRGCRKCRRGTTGSQRSLLTGVETRRRMFRLNNSQSTSLCVDATEMHTKRTMSEA